MECLDSVGVDRAREETSTDVSVWKDRLTDRDGSNRLQSEIHDTRYR